MPRIGPNDPASAYPQGQDLRVPALDADGLILVGQLPIAELRTIIGDGSGSGVLAYRHTQSTPATIWQINHALGFDPAGLIIIDAAGDTIDGAAVQYLVAGQTMRLSFDLGVAGTAYLS